MNLKEYINTCKGKRVHFYKKPSKGSADKVF